MQLTEKQELEKFILANVNHQGNSSSFHYQMETEIASYLKRQQQHFKNQRIRIRNEQLQREDAQQRQKLKEKLQKKDKITYKNKSKKLQDRVKSMSELRQRRQQFVTSKLNNSRKQELKKSLAKIKKIQEEKDQILQNKLITQSSSNLSRVVKTDHLQRRNNLQQAEYDALIGKLEKKGIYNNSPKKQLSMLYQQKVKEIKARQQSSEKQKAQRLGEKLVKIDAAREKKEKMIREKVEKQIKQEEYQNSLKKERRAQIEKQQILAAKKIMLEHASILQKSKNNLEISNSSKLQSSAMKNPEAQQMQIISKQASFRQEIRKQIESFSRRH